MLPKLSDEARIKLQNLARDCIRMSDDKLSERVRDWELSEQANRSYMPAADAERKMKQSSEQVGFTKLVIPYGYAMQLAAHTYLSSVFLARSPVFQFDGLNGQGQDEVLAVEAMVDYNFVAGEMATPQYFFFNDLLQYGVGIMGEYWDKTVHNITTWQEVPRMVEGVLIEGQFDTEEIIQKVDGYEGNKLYNVRPKEMIIDPRVGWARYQDGEFIGRRYQESIMALEVSIARGDYYEVELHPATDKDNELAGDNPALIETSSHTLSLDMKTRKGFANLIELYVRLVPSEYGFGKNTSPEIWVLTILRHNHEILGLVPLGNFHGKFPFTIQTVEFDGYTLSSRGFPEIAQPLNQTLNWLLNSHMYNVEKTVNNEYIYDPTMINQRDFLDPRPGKRIRIRPEAYGKDVRMFVHQLQQHDMTQTNFQDIKVVELMFQRIFGINDQMLGSLAQGGRKTATEIRSAAGFGINRLKVLAEFTSAMSYGPLANRLLSNCRQLYDQPMKLKIAGGAGLGKEMQDIDPSAIAGMYNFAPVDGAMPIDRMAQTQVYMEMLNGIAMIPQVAGRYDIATLFAWIAQLAGVKNLPSFEIQDPAKVQKEAELGNLVVSGGQHGPQ